MPLTGPHILSILKRAILLGAVWCVLTGAGRNALIAGLLVLPPAVWLSMLLLPPTRALRLYGMAAFLPGFLWSSLRGGIDVARRAFHPRMPLNPGWMVVPVGLPDGGKVALGGALSLMPGTLVAGRDDEGRLLVHLLDRDQDVEGLVRLEEARMGAMLRRGSTRTAP